MSLSTYKIDYPHPDDWYDQQVCLPRQRTGQHQWTDKCPAACHVVFIWERTHPGEEAPPGLGHRRDYQPRHAKESRQS